jgi:thiol-disulfide isomerase/thioredoxin
MTPPADRPLWRRRDTLRAAPLLVLAPWAAAEPGPLRRGEPVAWPGPLPLVGGGSWQAQPGQAAVVVFWSTTCPYCQRHNQHVEKLHRSLQGQALTVLGAAREADAARVERHLAAQQLSFPVTLAWRELAAALSPRRVIPLTVTVDRGGRLHEVIAGEMFESDVLGLARLGA